MTDRVDKKCRDCGAEFVMDWYEDLCPHCEGRVKEFTPEYEEVE